MSYIGEGRIFDEDEIDLIESLNNLAISNPNQAIQKIDSTTFANANFNTDASYWTRTGTTISTLTANDSVTLTKNDIKLTSVASMVIANNTASDVVNTQQNTPSLNILGSRWTTDGTPRSETTEWKVWAEAATGIAAQNYSYLRFDHSKAGAAVTTPFYVTHLGVGYFLGGANVNASFNANVPNITTTSTNGLYLNSSTASTVGTPVRYSPAIVFRGKAWNTTVTAADNTINFKAEVIPVSGTSTTGSLVFSYDNNGGGYTQVGNISYDGNYNSASGVYAPGGFYCNRTSMLTTPVIMLSVTAIDAADAVNTVRYSPSFNMRGRAWNTTTPASNTINFKQEVRPTSGATTSGSLFWAFDNNGGGYSDKMSLSSTGLLTLPQANLLTTYTDGLLLINDTASDAGNIAQNSPALDFKAHYWTSSDHYSNYFLVNVGGSFYIRRAVDGGASASVFNVDGSSVSIPGVLNSNQANLTTTSSDGVVLNSSTAALVGTPVRYSPSLRFTGRAWNTTTPASNTINFKEEVIPVSGATTSGSLVWSFDNNGGGYAEKARLTSLGRFGLNVATPISMVDVNYDSSVTATSIRVTNTIAHSSTAGAGILAYSDSGASLVSGDRCGWLIFGGATDGANTRVNACGIQGMVEENWSGTNQGAGLQFLTTVNGATTASRSAKMFLKNNGRLGVGRTDPASLVDINNTGTVTTTVNAALILDNSLAITTSENVISSIQFQNLSSGAAAEMRFIAAGDGGTYMAFTHPSSGNSGTFWGATKSTGDFIFSSARDLYLGTIAAKDIYFATDNANSKIAMKIVSATNLVTIPRPGIATTNTAGLTLNNDTAATLAVPVQYSPEIHLLGHRWATDTAVDQTSEWRIYNQATSGTATSSNMLYIDHSRAGAAYINAFNLSSGGSGYFTGALGASGAITGVQGINSSRSSLTTTSTMGFWAQETTASTAGVPVRYSPTLDFTAHSWNTTTPADNSINFRFEVRPTSGATTAGSLYLSFDNNGGGYSDLMSLDSGGSLYIARVASTYSLELARASIVTASYTGLLLNSSSAALVGTPVRYSPAQIFTARGWDLDDAVSRSISWKNEVRPVSANIVSGSIYWAWDLDGGGYTDVFQISSSGATITGSSNIWKSVTTTPSDGQTLVTTATNSAGVPVNYSPRIRLTGKAWNTTTPATNTINFTNEVIPETGATTSGRLSWSFDNNAGGYTEIASLKSTGVFTAKGYSENIVTKATADSTYIVLATDGTILGNTVGGNLICTLPTPVGIQGRKYTVKKIDAANTMTIGTAAGTIDGAATISLTTIYDSITVISDNVNWWVI